MRVYERIFKRQRSRKIVAILGLLSVVGCLLLMLIIVTNIFTNDRIAPYIMLAVDKIIRIPSEPPPKEEAWPSWAPDGKRLAYECYLDGPILEGGRSVFGIDEGEGYTQSFYRSDAADICITNLDRQNQMRVTTDSGGDWHPVWSPDGSHIAYLRQDGIYVITPDGYSRRQLLPLNTSFAKLAFTPNEDINLTWSPQGDKLLFSGCLNNSDHDIYVVDINTGTVTNLTPDSRLQDVSPTWALDGAKIVYLSTASSVKSNSCVLSDDASYQLKTVNSDGGGENILLDEQLFFANLAISNSGRLIFVGYMISEEPDGTPPALEDRKLYIIDIRGGELVEAKQDEDIIISPSWSPTGKYLTYRLYDTLKVIDIESNETIELPTIEVGFIENNVWSPDNRRIAVTVWAQEDGAIEREDHIYIFDIQTRTIRPLLQK